MKKEELQKLSRLDLVELLLDAIRENRQLHSELDDVFKQLEARDRAIQESSSMAEAALRLNGVLEAVQAAADQYLDNVRTYSQQQINSRMTQETLEKCNRMMAETQTQVDNYLNQVCERFRQVSISYLPESREE